MRLKRITTHDGKVYFINKKGEHVITGMEINKNGNYINIHPVTLRERFTKFTMGLCSGFCTTVLLVAVFHLLHLTKEIRMDGYPLTRLIEQCISPSFILCYFFAGILLARFRFKTIVTAFGMMLPIPLGAIIEGLLDKTSHNLLGLEVVLRWVPAFLLSLAAIWIGKRLVRTRPKDGREADDSAM